MHFLPLVGLLLARLNKPIAFFGLGATSLALASLWGAAYSQALAGLPLLP